MVSETDSSRLASNLYTSQARFVFELLQNADDNQYTRGQDPYVVFRVYPDRIVIECNEDGFTQQNLTAICDIGKSSKTGSQGYIGEKGIGFKSVFMAAWRVHIQSGNFSFDFVHRKGDSGMGMITPIWQERSDPALPFELTRITLYLHDQSDPADRERDRQIINQQFLELQDTLLLFLRKLRKIEVSFHDEEGSQTKGVIFTLSRIEGSDAAVIERTCTDAAQNRKRTYHIVKHIARGLARSENRDLSDAEEATRSFATSEIVLAFPVIEDPVTEEEVPVIEPQEVFAFLPVRKMGFNVSGCDLSLVTHVNAYAVPDPGRFCNPGKSTRHCDDLSKEPRAHRCHCGCLYCGRVTALPASNPRVPMDEIPAVGKQLSMGWPMEGPHF
jgi:hypothetical protein